MNENSEIFFYQAIMGGLGLVTLGLAVYLGYLLKSISAQKKLAKQAEDKRLKALEDHANYLKDSIITISKATIQGQCETSEACIRIYKLLEYFPDIAKEEKYDVLSKMNDELSSFAYLDERQELSKQEKFNQDKERFKVEEKFNDSFIKALKSLVEDFEALK